MISVEEALSRLLEPLDGVAARADLDRRRARPRPRRGCRRAPDAAAFRGLGDGRLRGPRRGSGSGPGRIADRRRGAGRGRVRRTCRRRRSRAHLHRGAIAGGHRHDRHPGGHASATAIASGCSKARRAAAMCGARVSISPKARCCCAPERRLTARDIGLLAAMNRPWLFVHRRPRDRHPVDRRRDRHARRSDRAAPDRQLEQPLARRLCRGLRRSAGIGRQRPGRSGGTAPHRRRYERGRPAGDDRRRIGRRARSGARRARPPTGWSSISGRSRCGPESR